MDLFNQFSLFLTLIGFVFAACLGSYFNVVHYRVPLEISVFKPASRCGHCLTPIRFYDNIPILSWFILRGKCRTCKSPYSIKYALFELYTGLLGAFSIWFYLNFAPHPSLFETVAFFLLTTSCIPIFVLDFKHFLIPSAVVLPFALLTWGISWEPQSTLSPLWSAVGGFGCAFGLWGFSSIVSYFAKKDTMGFGDVQLVFFTGTALGLQNGFLSIILGSFLGLIAILGARIFLNRSIEEPLPFGPFLIVGALIAFWFGNNFWIWYAHFLQKPL